MAHGYLEHFTDENWKVFSAGVEKHGVNPFAIGVMAEDGINIMNYSSNHVDEYADISFDIVLTVCDHAKEKCPIYFGDARLIHKSFEDPAHASGGTKEVMKTFRSVRDEIKEYCRNLIFAHS